MIDINCDLLLLCKSAIFSPPVNLPPICSLSFAFFASLQQSSSPSCHLKLKSPSPRPSHSTSQNLRRLSHEESHKETASKWPPLSASTRAGRAPRPLASLRLLRAVRTLLHVRSQPRPPAEGPRAARVCALTSAPVQWAALYRVGSRPRAALGLGAKVLASRRARPPRGQSAKLRCNLHTASLSSLSAWTASWQTGELDEQGEEMRTGRISGAY